MPQGPGTYGSKRGRPPMKAKAGKTAMRSAPKKKKEDSPFDNIKEGALHKQLKIPEDKKIPRALLNKIKKAKVGDMVEGHKVTALMKKRVNFALNFGK